MLLPMLVIVIVLEVVVIKVAVVEVVVVAVVVPVEEVLELVFVPHAELVPVLVVERVLVMVRAWLRGFGSGNCK